MRFQIDQVLGAFGAVAGLPLALVAYARHLPTGLPITLMVACIAYIMLSRRGFNDDQSTEPTGFFGPTVSIMVNISFLILFCVSVIVSLNSVYARPISYFLIVTGLVGIILVEILGAGSFVNLTKSVLPKILALALNLQLGRYFLFPTIAGIDPFVHLFFSDWVIQHGHVLSDSPYTAFPGAQIAAAMLTLVNGVPLKLGLYLAIGFPTILTLVVVFKTAEFFLSTRASLLATLLASLSTYLAGLRVEMGPQALAFSLFVFIFYLMMRETIIGRSSRAVTAMLILFIVSITTTHTLTALITCVVVVTVPLATKISGSKTHLWLLALLGPVFVVSYWIFASAFFGFGVSLLLDTIRNISALGFPLHFLSSTESDLAWSGTYILYGIAILGGLAYLSRKMRNAGRVCLVLIMLTLLGISYTFFVAISSYAIIPDRWYPFALILAVIPGSDAVMRLTGRAKLAPVLMLGLILSFAFLSITSPLVNDDVNDGLTLYTRKVMRTSFTENELYSARFVNSSYRGVVSTDILYGERVFILTLNHGELISDIATNYTRILEAPQKMTVLTTSMLSGEEPVQGLVVIRTEALSGPVEILSGVYARGAYTPYHYVMETYPSSFVEETESTGNIVYNSASVITVLLFTGSRQL
jgi:hypothetical protein